MTRLYDRVVIVTVDTLQISGLRVAFEIKRSAGKEPNTAKVSLWNLSERSRKALQTKRVNVVVEAGYRGDIAQLYAGDLRNVISQQDGADWCTTMESGDGEKHFRAARVSRSFRRGEFGTLLKEAATTLGVGVGNALQMAGQGKFSGAIKTLSHGVVLNGRSTDVLDRLARSAGLEWSIQDGQLQLLELGKAMAGTAVLLTPRTGLVGSPEIGDKGRVKVTSLLQPGIAPGRKIKIQSRHVDGLFCCRAAVYSGDTHGDNWHVEIEAAPL